MGPSIVFDKSALQALSIDESVWLEAFCSANMVPVFYVETLADLEKTTADRGSEKIVGELAAKTPANAFPNVHHRQLVFGSLMGRPFDMDGRPVVGAGDYRRSPAGKIGLHVEEFPEAVALERWRDGDFLAIEHDVAKAWREELAAHDAQAVAASLRNVLPRDRRISDLAQLKAFIDAYCASALKKTLELLFEFFDIPEGSRRTILRRWSSARKPPLPRFAPYAAHALKVELLFYLGVARGFISGDRPSNRADMAYLLYLPFCDVFVSGDRLHARTAPLFLTERQTYLATSELKSALQQFDEYHERLPQEVKDLGVMQFAGYPPAEIDNAVTRVWDEVMRPDWRDQSRIQAERRGRPRDDASDQMTVAELNEIVDKATSVGDEAAPASGPEYLMLQRRVRPTKGKWRMVSREVEAGQRASDPADGGFG